MPGAHRERTLAEREIPEQERVSLQQKLVLHHPGPKRLLRGTTHEATVACYSLPSPEGLFFPYEAKPGKCNVKLCTTRLITPLSDGESGRRPSSKQRKNASNWP